jgi:starch synthase
LLASLEEALDAFQNQAAWKKLMLNGMKKDFSWTASAREYVKVYERVVAQKPAASAEKPAELSRV